MSILTFEGVTRWYGPVEALRGVDLRIDEPCVYGLVGRNGSGKTTMLRMVPCLLHPTSGNVRVFGLDPWAAQEQVKRRLGYLSDEDNWPTTLRARDLIDAHRGAHARWDGDLQRRLLERFGLYAERRMGQMSKGQKRQVGLICAVCHYPELLVLDEPAGGLDPVARRELLQTVVELLAGTGSTVVFSSHNFADVQRLAERVGVLHKGRMLADEPLARMQERCCRAVVAGDKAALGRLQTETVCVRLARRGEGWLATLRCRPDDAADVVGACGAVVQEVQAMDLEQLFIDWTGGS